MYQMPSATSILCLTEARSVTSGVAQNQLYVKARICCCGGEGGMTMAIWAVALSPLLPKNGHQCLPLVAGD
jgi:hypothetical protein